MAAATGAILLGETPIESLDDYLAAGGSDGLTRALAGDPGAVIDEIERSGLRGRGGAGFPTGIKWRSVAGSDPGSPKHLVCNAAEGEPGTFKDRWLMRRNPYQLIEGIAIAAYAIGAQEAHLALKASFTPELAAVRRAIDELTSAGFLGAFPIDVHEGPDEYLFGEEKALLEVLEGNLPMPRILPPYQEGLYASPGSPNPTAVNNVETLSNVPHIMREGASWFRSFGTESSPGTMVFTLVGDVRAPGIYELPLGVSARTLLEEIGGGTVAGPSLKVILPGASAGVLVPEQLDVPLDFDVMRDVGSGLGSAGFIVYDDSACVVQIAHLFSRFLWVESCAQCPACKHGTEEITRHLDRIERGEGDESDLQGIARYTGSVTDGQRCALPTGEALLMRTLLDRFDDEFRAHLGRSCPTERKVALPKLVAFDEQTQTFAFDEGYARKGPDWMRAD